MNSINRGGAQPIDGFLYNIKQDIESLKESLGKEWEQDHREFPDQPWTLEWLTKLQNSSFEMKRMHLSAIVPRKDLMTWVSGKYVFAEELSSRVSEARENISETTIIDPLVVLADTNELVDGYMRYTLLQEMGAKEVLVYVMS